MMKYIFQLAVILTVSFMGELLKLFLPFPIPANVYGLLLMLFFLCTGIIRLSQVEETADFFMSIMPVLFVPLNAALMEYAQAMMGHLFGLLLVAVTSTLAALCVTMLTAQHVIKRKQRKKEAGHE